jgi:hypothetical protein
MGLLDMDATRLAQSANLARGLRASHDCRWQRAPVAPQLHEPKPELEDTGRAE